MWTENGMMNTRTNSPSIIRIPSVILVKSDKWTHSTLHTMQYIHYTVHTVHCVATVWLMYGDGCTTQFSPKNTINILCFDAVKNCLQKLLSSDNRWLGSLVKCIPKICPLQQCRGNRTHHWLHHPISAMSRSNHTICHPGCHCSSWYCLYMEAWLKRYTITYPWL